MKNKKGKKSQLSADSSVDRCDITETDFKGNKEKHFPSSDSEMLAKILQLTTETHAIMAQNKKVIEKYSLSSATSDQGQGKSSLKSNDFYIYIAHLIRCRFMSELLKNQLMKPFNISKITLMLKLRTVQICQFPMKFQMPLLIQTLTCLMVIMRKMEK